MEIEEYPVPGVKQSVLVIDISMLHNQLKIEY